jgi:hypothetical protein
VTITSLPVARSITVRFLKFGRVDSRDGTVYRHLEITQLYGRVRLEVLRDRGQRLLVQRPDKASALAFIERGIARDTK